MSNKKLLIQAWTVIKIGNEYFLPYTHYVYIEEISKYFDEIYLLSPIKIDQQEHYKSLKNLKNISKVNVISLPYSIGYLGAIRHFLSYYRAYKKLSFITVFYVRYPTPFGWLAKYFHRNKKIIIHFVGDPIDATKSNPNLGYLRKRLLLFFFKPEHLLYEWACKGAKVFTNGFHLAKKLENKNIKVKGLISSTLKSNDFFLDSKKIFDITNPKLLYVGYLRKAKGIETIIYAFNLLQNEIPNAELTIVGSGEFEGTLLEIIKVNHIKNVRFLGHIDNRDKFNSILRKHDIFCFASLSEGSPRVVLEAMANGLAVVSSPVGSLPGVFKKDKEILFAHFNNPESFRIEINKLIYNNKYYNELRKASYEKVQNYTIDNFIKTIFHEK